MKYNMIRKAFAIIYRRSISCYTYIRYRSGGYEGKKVYMVNIRPFYYAL